MRGLIWLTLVGFLNLLGVAAAQDTPFNAEVLNNAFELGKTCTTKCRNDAVSMDRLPLAQGRVGFLIISNDRDFCGNRGCSSAVVTVSGSKFLKIKEGLGITKEQAVLVASGDGDPSSVADGKPSFDCSKATSAAARLICADADLAKADGLLGARFKVVADTDQATRSNLLEQQVGWIRARNIRCGLGPDKAQVAIEQLKSSKPCMLESINARIAELGAKPVGTKANNASESRIPTTTVGEETLKSDSAAMSVTKDTDFVILGPGDPYRDMFQTLSFSNSALKSGGKIYCRQKNAKAGLGTATEIFLQSYERSVFENEAQLKAILTRLAAAVETQCQHGVRTGKLFDADDRKPITVLPSKVVVTIMNCFVAHSDKGTGLWTVQQNCVMDQQIKAQAEQAERQRIAAQIATDRINQANIAARAVFAARKEFGPSLETTEGREFVLPILRNFSDRAMGVALHRVVCADSYEYVGGSVLGRSIEGNVGVILVNIVAVNKSNSPIETNSMVGSQCGNPSRLLKPGDILNIEAKGMFRKYDTGWRFEQMMN